MTKYQTNIIKLHYGQADIDELAKRLKTTTYEVQQIAKQVGLPHRWSESETKFVKDNYYNITLDKIAAIIGVSRVAIVKLADKLGMERHSCKLTTKEERIKICEEISLRYKQLISLFPYVESRKYPYPYMKGIVFYYLHNFKGYKNNHIAKAVDVDSPTVLYISRKVEGIIKGELIGYDEVVKMYKEFMEAIKNK